MGEYVVVGTVHNDVANVFMMMRFWLLSVCY